MTAPVLHPGAAGVRPFDPVDTLWMREDNSYLLSVRNRLEVLAKDYKADPDLASSLTRAAHEVALAAERLQHLLTDLRAELHSPQRSNGPTVPRNPMNATTQTIIARLPKKPLLSTGDIAAACGLATSNSIIADIKTGKLDAAVIGGKYIVSREAASRYVEASAYTPEEGPLK